MKRLIWCAVSVLLLLAVPAHAQSKPSVLPSAAAAFAGAALGTAVSNSLSAGTGVSGLDEIPFPEVLSRIPPDRLLDVQISVNYYTGQQQRGGAITGLSYRQLFEATIANAKAFEIVRIKQVYLSEGVRLWFYYIGKGLLVPLPTEPTKK